MYIYIYLEEPLGFFFCPQRLGSRIGIFTRKFAKLGRFTYAFLSFFISKCFFVLRRHFAPRHFYPEVRRKTRNLGGKKRNSAEFCSKHVSALNNMKRPYKKLSASFFFGPRHLFWESAEIKAYRQVRHFFLPRGVCMSYTHLPLRRWQSSNLL